jgi:hypothetical protein
MTPIAMRSFHPMIVWSTFMETTVTMVWMRLPLSTTCRDIVPETSILVPFAALRQMEVGEISQPCLFAELRLIRERVAPVSASTWSANVGFPTGFRLRNSGSVGLQKSLTLLTLLTVCVTALQLSKSCHFLKSCWICAHSSDCCCCCCWCLCCWSHCCLWCCLNA